MGEKTTFPIRATRRSRKRLDIMAAATKIYLMSRPQMLDIVVSEAWERRIADGTVNAKDEETNDVTT